MPVVTPPLGIEAQTDAASEALRGRFRDPVFQIALQLRGMGVPLHPAPREAVELLLKLRGGAKPFAAPQDGLVLPDSQQDAHWLSGYFGSLSSRKWETFREGENAPSLGKHCFLVPIAIHMQ